MEGKKPRGKGNSRCWRERRNLEVNPSGTEKDRQRAKLEWLLPYTETPSSGEFRLSFSGGQLTPFI